jgi:hypothetical protein
LQEKRSLEEIKSFIRLLEPDIVLIKQPLFVLENDLLDTMAAAAFNYDRRDVVRFLCSVGAPLKSIASEYKVIKKFLPRKTVTRKMFMLKNCARAYKKAKTRRNTNNNKTNSV